MSEQWRDVDGFKGEYEVSDQGRVRCWYSRGRKLAEPRAKRPVRNHHGYYQISLQAAGKTTTRTVQRVVLEAFKGKCPDGHSAAHLNGDRSDNRLVNLDWLTHRANIAQKAEHGTLARGESHGMAVLDVTEVREIRRRCDAGERHGAVAADYGVTRECVGMIVRRQTWKHVP